MTPVSFVELPVDLRIARCRRVNPFHWALLRSLLVFVPGARPDFDGLAERLRILERAFLDRAWSGILEARCVDDEDYAQARLTGAGEAALRERYFVLGEPGTRSHKLYFNKKDGAELRSANFVVAAVGGLRATPGWSRTLGDGAVVGALAAQSPAQALRVDERLLGFTPRWGDAREVKVTQKT